MQPNINVLQMSSVHFCYDPRVVFRMSATLAKHYKTTLLIPKGDKNAVPNLKTIGLPLFKKIWQRVLFVHPIIFFRALWLNPKIIHFHDPELIPLGLVLRLLFRKIVIFDIHEHIRLQLGNKSYNNNALYVRLFVWFNGLAEQHLNLIFAETPHEKLYPNRKKTFATILNYPALAFYKPYINTQRQVETDGKINLFYIGGLSLERSLDTMIAAVALLVNIFPNICLHLIGESYLVDNEVLKSIEGYEKAKDNLIFYGKQSPSFGFDIATKCILGIALLKPIGNYSNNYPTKIYEYMSVGLPVIASDFEHVRAIVEDHSCGFCINPTDAVALAASTKQIIDDRNLAAIFSINGLQTAQEQYSWEGSEAPKLLSFYHSLLA